MVSESLCRVWDTNALTLGQTPKLDRYGRVVPIGVPEDPSVPESKRKYYVVWIGRARGLFHNWGLVSTLVTGFSGNAHKLYVGLENARAAWETGPKGSDHPWTPPKPGPPRATPNLAPLPRPSEDIVDDDDDYEFPEVNNPTRALPIHVAIDPEDYRELRNDAKAAGVPSDYLYRHAPGSPSSASSVLTTASWMSSGSLTPRTVGTPNIVSSMAGLSLGQKFTEVDASLSRVRAEGGGSSASAGSPAGRAYMLTPTPVSGDRRAGPSVRLDKRRAASRAKGDPVFVVVRGEHPGVYFEDETALIAAGFHPAVKIVHFRSLKVACLYFVQQYMAGKVGVPIFVVPGDDEDAS